MEGSLDRLVNTSKHILRLLYDGSTNANQIIKQTSSDRSYVFNVIKTLQEEGLISESTNPEIHKQKKTKNLTELGREIAEIIKSVQSCYELCDGLKHDCKKDGHPLDFKLIPVSPDKYLISVQNMETGGKNLIGIAILNHAAADYVRDFVIFKYLLLSRKYDVRKKKITSQILEQIISDATKRQMDAIMKGIVWTADPSQFIADFGEHATKITNLPEKMRRYGLLSNKFSRKEKAKEVLLSVLPMLRSERESILESIGEVNAITEMQKQIHELKFEIDLEEGKPYRKEDPTERERDALYQEIRKALS
jgi:DNA-binding MarR family transcriptional regulator